MARVEVFAADETAIVHVMNRTVRRCFLLGDDAFSGKNFGHRKVWLDEQLMRIRLMRTLAMLRFPTVAQ